MKKRSGRKAVLTSRAIAGASAASAIRICGFSTEWILLQGQYSRGGHSAESQLPYAEWNTRVPRLRRFVPHEPGSARDDSHGETTVIAEQFLTDSAGLDFSG